MSIRFVAVAGAAALLAVFLFPTLDTGQGPGVRSAAGEIGSDDGSPPPIIVTPEIAETRARNRLGGWHTVLCPPSDVWFRCHGDVHVYHFDEQALLVASPEQSGTAICEASRARLSYELRWSPDGCELSNPTPMEEVTLELVDVEGQPVAGRIEHAITYGLGAGTPIVLLVSRAVPQEVSGHQVDEAGRVVWRSVPELIGDRDHVTIRLTEEVAEGDEVRPAYVFPASLPHYRSARVQWSAAIGDPDLGLNDRVGLAYGAAESAVVGWMLR